MPPRAAKKTPAKRGGRTSRAAVKPQNPVEEVEEVVVEVKEQEVVKDKPNLMKS